MNIQSLFKTVQVIQLFIQNVILFGLKAGIKKDYIL